MAKSKGGNSHERAVARAHKATELTVSKTSTPDSATAAMAMPAITLASDPQKAENPDRRPSWGDRTLRFIEAGSFQMLLGIMSSLVGTFLDGRYFTILGIYVPIALHRSKSLEKMKSTHAFLIHAISAVLTFALLFWMGVSLNKSKPHTYSPSEYAASIRNNTPLPITQQITNIYNSYAPPDKQIGEPRIELSAFQVDSADPSGALRLHTSAINTGTVVARDLTNSTDSVVADKSTAIEDELFEGISRRTADLDQPRRDQPPGLANLASEPVYTAALTDEQRSDLRAGRKVLYIGEKNLYKGPKGQMYSTELCMYSASMPPYWFYCNGHNTTARQVSGR